MEKYLWHVLCAISLFVDLVMSMKGAKAIGVVPNATLAISVTKAHPE